MIPLNVLLAGSSRVSLLFFFFISILVSSVKRIALDFKIINFVDFIQSTGYQMVL